MKSNHVDDAVALAIDAHTLFVYWNVSDITQKLLAEHFEMPWPRMRLALRTMDETGHRDEDICHTTSQFYVKGLPSGQDYVVDFGVWGESQHFFTIVRSNVVHTPYVYSPAAPYVYSRAVSRADAPEDSHPHTDDHAPAGVPPLDHAPQPKPQAQARNSNPEPFAFPSAPPSAHDWKTTFTGYSLGG